MSVVCGRDSALNRCQTSLIVVIPHRDKVCSCVASAIMQLHVSVARVFAPRQSFLNGPDGELNLFPSSTRAITHQNRVTDCSTYTF